MKIVKLDLKEEVYYYGIKFQLPYWIRYLAVDKNGSLYGYMDYPLLYDSSWSALSGNVIRIGTVDLEGINWEETLVCVQ